MPASDLLQFVFPAHCLVCGKGLHTNNAVLCLKCEYTLPRTGYTGKQDNPVYQSFWGRVRLEMATSLFRFEKGSAYQQILHELKYRGNRHAARLMGRMLANELKDSCYNTCDMLVPVPIHPKRMRQRGYNQSEYIARGLSDIMHIPIETRLLRRISHHPSQTALGRYDRFLNVHQDFRLHRKAPDAHGARIILVDDVLTTGATLEACSEQLLRHFSCKVYVATLCCA